MLRTLTTKEPRRVYASITAVSSFLWNRGLTDLHRHFLGIHGVRVVAGTEHEIGFAMAVKIFIFC